MGNVVLKLLENAHEIELRNVNAQNEHM